MGKKQNLRLLLCTHKNFTVPDSAARNGNIYRIITEEGGEVKDTKGIEQVVYKKSPLTRSHNEHSVIEEALKDKEHKLNTKYMGTCQYRRYFDPKLFDQLDEIFKENDIVVCPLRLNGTVRSQYRNAHNEEDLEKVVEIIREKYPDYEDAIHPALADSVLFAANMVILPTKEYIKLNKWVEEILNEFDQKYGLKDDADTLAYVIRNKDKYKNQDMNYQARLDGFLSERIMHIYVMKNYHKPYKAKMIMLR